MTSATIRVGAFVHRPGTVKKAILDRAGLPMFSELECSTDIPADALGEVCAEVMQRAWGSVGDGTHLVLEVSFK